MKAVVLLSGGLDSILAAKLVQREGVELIGATFVSFFFDNSRMAQKQADRLDIPLRVVDISQEQWRVVKNPAHGYGAGMNPCRDCHALMLAEAKKIMQEEKARFLVTGEVLGQRPLSQNRSALELIEKEAEVKGLVLRPLSAKLLPESRAEKEGWVNQDNMLAISGRQRKKQLQLAEEWGIEEFHTPAGGCLLTDPQFSQRLQELLDHRPDPHPTDLQLLKVGRHFWHDGDLIVVGRDKEENAIIKELSQSGDRLMELVDIPGPTTLIRGPISQKSITEAKRLTKRYANKAKGKDVEYRLTIKE